MLPLVSSTEAFGYYLVGSRLWYAYRALADIALARGAIDEAGLATIAADVLACLDGGEDEVIGKADTAKARAFAAEEARKIFAEARTLREKQAKAVGPGAEPDAKEE
ncbi:hypothetical protein FHS55_002079 [Angulomicrobium tetraedrale]|uniref:Uncharacterized protein n=1 Tax=Ancylobacter tetraedralis TaxID=217068 RepID=A0A839Z9R7_9HYPH|nr:hypothetical protein [Ancylobacter tetraedralis]MBB3771480.1 hypothetical protein [Ancylobacter tetraedralis]